VFTLFGNAVFWSVMTDCWTSSQGRRLFPAIGIGGTLGALSGSAFTGSTATRIEGIAESLGVPNENSSLVVMGSFMLASLMLMEIAVWALRLTRKATTRMRLAEPQHASHEQDAPRSSDEESLKGSAWDGVPEILHSKYLLGLCGYIVCMTVSSTLLYFIQARIVSAETVDPEVRIQLFAIIDFGTQSLTLIMQLLIVGHVLRRFNVDLCLAVLPLVTLCGFVALAVSPTFTAIALIMSMHRATRYAFARPGRETLFTIVPREQKYKAKSFIDTFVYRGGDVIGMVSDGILSRMIVMLAVGSAGMLFAVAPLVALWLMISYFLGAEHARRASETPASRDGEQEGEPTDHARPA